MKTSQNDLDNTFTYLLKNLPSDFIKEVESILLSNNNHTELWQIESLISKTLHKAGFNWDDIELHLIWKSYIIEIIRIRDEIYG
jgi:predicted oxidoreductase (fatty acid repression mutant protein)